MDRQQVGQVEGADEQVQVQVQIQVQVSKHIPSNSAMLLEECVLYDSICRSVLVGWSVCYNSLIGREVSLP